MQRLPRVGPRVLSAYFLVALSACVSARSVVIGEGAPPRPDDCQLSYERADPTEAGARWHQVGTVCVAPWGSGDVDVSYVYAPGDTKDALTSKACHLGAQIVSPVGLCSNGKQQGIEFGAYVPRDAPAPVAPGAQ